MSKYTNLSKYKKAYVVCAVGQSYIDASEYIIKGLQRYSKYPVILYYTNGLVNYKYDNCILQPFSIKDRVIDDGHSLKLFTTLKAEITLSSIKNYDVDTIVMLDSDIVVTPSIDNIFKDYELELENYPIFMKYSWDIITIMGRPHVGEYLIKYINAGQQRIPAMCSCCCIANRNCLSFLEDWKRYCEDEHLIDYYYKANKDIYFDFNDESIVNALLWKYGATKYIPTNFAWAWKNETARFCFDFYDGKVGELERHSSLPTHWKIPEPYEVPFGLSVLPEKKRNLWGFHGPKDVQEIENIMNEIENRV